MKHNLFISTVLLTVLLAGCGGNKKQQYLQQQTQPRQYPTLTIQRTTATLEKNYPATVRGQEDIDIMPRINGYIDRIYVDEGSVVKKGQRLFSINSPEAVQGLATANAGLIDAEANLNTARLNVDRMQPLADKNIISTVQLDTYRNQYQSAQAALAQAQANVTQAQATIGWTTVTSPVDGVVGTIPYRQGSLVTSATVLTTVANTNNVYAYFSLNEKDLYDLLSTYPGTSQEEKISRMPNVTLTLSEGTVYPSKGRIETISGIVNTTTGSANFRAEFPNGNGVLRSGMSGRVSIPRRIDGVFLIPQKATFTQLDKTLVYKVQGDSVVQAIITVEALPDGMTYAVTSGLDNNDTIVTDGVATLANGTKIKFIDAGSASGGYSSAASVPAGQTGGPVRDTINAGRGVNHNISATPPQPVPGRTGMIEVVNQQAQAASGEGKDKKDGRKPEDKQTAQNR